LARRAECGAVFPRSSTGSLRRPCSSAPRVANATAILFVLQAGLTGPSSFGSGSFEDANSGSGSLVGVAGSLAPFLILGVPVGYVSGSSLGTSTDTWDDATFASLGVTPGRYTWTWGSGKDADSFRLIVARGPRKRTCWSSCLSWLHLLRSWSLRSTRSGSADELARLLGADAYSEARWREHTASSPASAQE
jgi:hypothetical protein